MATRKPVSSNPSKTKQNASQSVPAPVPDEALTAQIQRETDSLMSVAENLASAAQNFAKQQQELQSVRTMQAEMQSVLAQMVKEIEKASVAGAIERESMVTAKGRTYIIPEDSRFKENPDCGCDCIHPGCCCYEIVLDKVRGIQPQGILEPADAGDVSIPASINELEVRIFASIDNIGVLIPSLSTTMGIRVPSILPPSTGGPGLWMPIGAVIGRIYVKKGSSRTITVDFQASEIDEGLERVIAGKDEHGAASGTITVDCCSPRIYPSTPTDLSFDHGDVGGGQPGAISLAFYARRVCC
jgi:hypothetical protein